MKNKKVIIIILILIIIGIVTGAIIKLCNKKSRDYEIAKVQNYNYFVIKDGEKYGVMDNKGNIIIDTKYENVKIPNPEKDIFVCYEGENTTVLNERNEEILKDYSNVEPLRLKNVSSDLVYEKTVLTYKKDDKFGLIDISGKKLTNPIYEEINTLKLKEGELTVKKDGKYAIININGAILVEPKYDNIEADAFYSNEESYKKDGYIVRNTTDEGYRYGYVDINGKLIVDVIYNDIKRINEIKENDVYLICASNGKYGLIKNGNKIIQNNYQSMTYSNGVLVVQNGKKYGVMSIKGNDIIGTEYSQVDITGDYLYAKDTEEKVKVFNKDGKEQDFDSNTQFLNIENKDYKIIIESENNKTVYGIYEDGKTTTNDEYNYIEYLFGDYFTASNLDGKLGIINDKGETIVNFDYNTIQKIGNSNVVQTTISDKKITDIYSDKLEKICSMEDAIVKFNEDYIKVYNNDEIKYISLKGENINVQQVLNNNKIFAKKKDGMWGFEDNQGNMVVDYKYDKVTEINEYGFAGIQKDGKWGVINNEGNVILEPTYTINLTDEPDFIGQYYKVQYGYGECYFTKN